jgi:hypothetical protein
MILLTSTSDLLQVVSGSTGTIQVHASWLDNSASGITPGRTNTADITTATTTTVVASPAASTQRNVVLLVVRNDHASSSNLISINHTDGTTIRTLWEGTLLAGEWITFDGNGDAVKYSSGGVTQNTQPAQQIDIQTFSTPGANTWTKPTAFTPKIVIAKLWGAGGGGGRWSLLGHCGGRKRRGRRWGWRIRARDLRGQRPVWGRYGHDRTRRGRRNTWRSRGGRRCRRYRRHHQLRYLRARLRGWRRRRGSHLRCGFWGRRGRRHRRRRNVRVHCGGTRRQPRRQRRQGRHGRCRGHRQRWNGHGRHHPQRGKRRRRGWRFDLNPYVECRRRIPFRGWRGRHRRAPQRHSGRRGRHSGRGIWDIFSRHWWSGGNRRGLTNRG